MQTDNNTLEQFQQEQQLNQLEQAVKQRLSKDALARVGNIKVAYPEKAMQVMMLLAKLISENDVEVIEDYQLKDLLKRLSEKREINIKRR